MSRRQLDQLDLFANTPGITSRDPTDTSVAAAVRVMPRTGTQRRKVYDYIAQHGPWGATDLELQHALALPGNSQRPRRIELVDAGWVHDSGQRRQGHIVWTTT